MNILEILNSLSFSAPGAADPQTKFVSLALTFFLVTATCRLALACFLDLGSQGVNLLERAPISVLPIGAGLLTMVGPFACLEFSAFVIAWGTLPTGASATVAMIIALSYVALHQSFFRAIRSDHPRALW